MFDAEGSFSHRHLKMVYSIISGADVKPTLTAIRAVERGTGFLSAQVQNAEFGEIVQSPVYPKKNCAAEKAWCEGCLSLPRNGSILHTGLSETAGQPLVFYETFSPPM